MTSPPLLEHAVSRIIGLLQAVGSAGGEEDVARLSMDFDEELDEIQPTLEAAEALGLAVVEDGRIRLTPEGKALLASKIRRRKTLFRERVLSIPLFQDLYRALASAPEGHLSKDEVLAYIAERTPGVPAEEVLKTVINWGRYAEILTYDTEGEEIRLKRQVAAASKSPPGEAMPPG